eukprot:COSAG01_NODE_2747_length_7149_cov_5.321844_7_plen_87_part_00
MGEGRGHLPPPVPQPPPAPVVAPQVIPGRGGGAMHSRAPSNTISCTHTQTRAIQDPCTARQYFVGDIAPLELLLLLPHRSLRRRNW